jgi:hypothetical protein
MTKALDRNEVIALLNDWRGSGDIEVIRPKTESDTWLCRFGGVLGREEGTGSRPFEIDVGGPEAWVSPAPAHLQLRGPCQARRAAHFATKTARPRSARRERLSRARPSLGSSRANPYRGALRFSG